MSHLTEKLDHEAEALRVSLGTNTHLRALFDGTIERDTYIRAILCQIYHYTHSTSVWLARSGERLTEDGSSAPHGRYLVEQAEEEAGHDLWALRDAVTLGAPADIVRHVPPSSAVCAYTVHNDATSRHGSPYAILGPKYVLEYLSVRTAGRASENLRRKQRIPGIESATTFLDGHATLDVDHLAEVRSVVNEVTDVYHQEAILASARITAALYSMFFSVNLQRLGA